MSIILDTYFLSIRFGRADFPKQKNIKSSNEVWIYVKNTITENLLEKQCGLKPGNGPIPSIANCFKDESIKNFFSHHDENYCGQETDLERPKKVICG